MHIADGIVPATVAIGSFAVAGGIAVGLARKLDREEIPRIAVTTAVLFVSSLFHIKVGGTSIHPILNGIAALILGPQVFLAIFTSLFFQAVMFSHGGITALGVNTLTIGGAALLIAYISIPILKKLNSEITASFYYFAVGFFALMLSGLFTMLFLTTGGETFSETAKIILIAHLPIALIEGSLAVIIIQFIKKANTEILYYTKGN